GGQLGVLGQQPGQAGKVAAVEDVAALDLQLQPGPAGEPVLAGERELSGSQHDAAGIDAPDRGRVAALGGVQQILGLMAELVQVGPGRQVRHDVSLVAPWSAAGPEEIATDPALLSCENGGGLRPARGPGG